MTKDKKKKEKKDFITRVCSSLIRLKLRIYSFGLTTSELASVSVCHTPGYIRVVRPPISLLAVPSGMSPLRPETNLS